VETPEQNKIILAYPHKDGSLYLRKLLATSLWGEDSGSLVTAKQRPWEAAERGPFYFR